MNTEVNQVKKEEDKAEQLALHIWEFLMCGFYQAWIENVGKEFQKVTESKTEFAAHSNYLHSIYIVLGIISIQEMI